MSATLETLSVRDIDSDRKTLTVPDNSMPISREIVSASEISAALEILSVSYNDSDIGTLVIPALETLSASATESDM